MKKFFEIAFIALIIVLCASLHEAHGSDFDPVVNYKKNSKGEKLNYSLEEIQDKCKNGTGFNLNYDDFLSGVAYSVSTQGKRDGWLDLIPDNKAENMLEDIFKYMGLSEETFSPSTMIVSGVNKKEKQLGALSPARSNYPGEQLVCVDMRDVYPEELQNFSGNTKVYLFSAICFNPVCPVGNGYSYPDQNDNSAERRFDQSERESASSDGANARASAEANVTVVSSSADVNQRTGGYTTGYAPYPTSYAPDYGCNQSGFGFSAQASFGFGSYGGYNNCGSCQNSGPSIVSPSTTNVYNYDSHDDYSSYYNNDDHSSYYNNEEYWSWYWEHHQITNNYGDTTHTPGGGPGNPPNGDGGGSPSNPTNDRPTGLGGYATKDPIGTNPKGRPTATVNPKQAKEDIRSNTNNQPKAKDWITQSSSTRPQISQPKTKDWTAQATFNRPQVSSPKAKDWTLADNTRPTQGKGSNVNPKTIGSSNGDMRPKNISPSYDNPKMVTQSRPKETVSGSVSQTQNPKNQIRQPEKNWTNPKTVPSPREYPQANTRPVQQNDNAPKQQFVKNTTPRFSKEQAKPTPQKNYNTPAPGYQRQNNQPRVSTQPVKKMSAPYQSSTGRRKR